jgi:hypothetical protein
MAKFQVIIGRSEKLSFPEFVLNVPAKIDTGAYRSSIHATSIKLTKKGGKQVLKVELLGHPASPVIYEREFDDFETVKVTNSFGHEEERYEIKLKTKLGSKVFTTSFTLADRSNNLFPILVGRKLLKNRYVVDVAKTSVDRVKLKQEFGIKAAIDEEDLED